VTCPAAGLTSGNHDGSVESGGRRRTYVVHVPSSYQGNVPVPAVFDFHGYGSSGMGQMGASGFRQQSDEHGFIAVYPDGVGGSWHVNGCCGQAAAAMLDEVAAVRAILSQLKQQLCIDPRRIYASGVSQGGGMAHHVACLAADVFAAVAPVSSDLRTEPCEPVQPVSEISFRGTADTLSAYEGGPVGPAGMQYQSIGALPTLARWAEINDCTDTAAPALELCQTHTQCADGSEVTLCTLPSAGHVLYTNPSNFAVAKTAWEMFARHSR
jgi:polyhydroxybutyrate depolymerase